MIGNRYPTGCFRGEDCGLCPYLVKRKCNRRGYCENHLKGTMKRWFRKWWLRYTLKMEVSDD